MYGTVIEGKLELHEGVPSLERMQEVVGGLIETAQRYPTERKDIGVDVYCNEEGLMLGLPVEHIRQLDRAPIVGNLVIVGGNDRTGDAVSLFENEIRAYSQYLVNVPPISAELFF